MQFGPFALAVCIAVVAVGGGQSGVLVQAFGPGGCDAPCLCCVVFGAGSKPACGTSTGECTCNGCSCRKTPGGSQCGGDAALKVSETAPPTPRSPPLLVGNSSLTHPLLVGNSSLTVLTHRANTRFVRARSCASLSARAR